MELHDILYEVDDSLALITLNRPKYRNAQSYRLLDELDTALAAADAVSSSTKTSGVTTWTSICAGETSRSRRSRWSKASASTEAG